MNYSKILACDTNNGNGFRVTLFVSGCTLHCKNCHNKEAQDFNFGHLFTQETEDKIIELLSKKFIRGFSLLGGEPMDNLQNGNLLKLLKRIKKEYPNKTIYCWTGYTYEKLIKKKECLEILKYIDMLRDGEYIAELRDLTQYLQGSSNQRYIDVHKSLNENKIIKYKFI